MEASLLPPLPKASKALLLAGPIAFPRCRSTLICR
jgi:hypothetical protein